MNFSRLSVHISLSLFVSLGGCAEMKTLDKKIYRVATAESVNYFLVRIESGAELSKANYRTGLYPSYAVDAFLGKDGSMPTDAASVEQEMRDMVAKEQKSRLAAYLSDPTGNADKLREVQQLPVVTEPQPRYRPLEFNPLLSLVDHTANKKYVIALSSNPDAILDQIAALAEEPQTVNAVTGAITSLFGALTPARPATHTPDTAASVSDQLGKLADKAGIDTLDKARAQLAEALFISETLR
jgi:hypothetical protein